jgi:hypothetical protein
VVSVGRCVGRRWDLKIRDQDVIVRETEAHGGKAAEAAYKKSCANEEKQGERDF